MKCATRPARLRYNGVGQRLEAVDRIGDGHFDFGHAQQTGVVLGIAERDQVAGERPALRSRASKPAPLLAPAAAASPRRDCSRCERRGPARGWRHTPRRHSGRWRPRRRCRATVGRLPFQGLQQIGRHLAERQAQLVGARIVDDRAVLRTIRSKSCARVCKAWTNSNGRPDTSTVKRPAARQRRSACPASASI